MTPRARPLSRDDRRTALIMATAPLLLEHGRDTTTRQIADAAGVAEGTIFRVFDSKHDLIQAAVAHSLDLKPLLIDLAAVEGDPDLRCVLYDLTKVLQHRFDRIFTLMSRMGMTGPPKSDPDIARARREAEVLAVSLLEPFAEQLTCSPAHLARVLRLVTFSGTHPHLSDGHLLTTEEIVTLVLDGLEKKDLP